METDSTNFSVSAEVMSFSASSVRRARAVPRDSDVFHAAACGSVEWLSLSVKRAAQKPLNTDEHGLTVLHIAALYGHVDCMKFLLDAADVVDVNVGCPDGRRPIHMVLTAQSKPNTHTCLTYLLEHGAQPNVTTDEGLTPLHLAAAGGLRECTETLVSNKADIHARDKRGHTPFDLARIWGHKAIARFLKDAMWRKDKEQDMEKRKQLHSLRQDLVKMYTVRESKEKACLHSNKGYTLTSFLGKARLTVNKQKSSDRVKKTGCTQKHHPNNLNQSSRRVFCLPTEPKMPNNPRAKWNISPIPSKPPPGSIARSHDVRMGTHPDEMPSEPDLRYSVTLGCWRDGRPRYVTSWDGIQHSLPDLPLNDLLKGLFPLAFPSRIDSPQHFQSSSVLDLPRLGRSVKPDASPWTEVVMHLVEELQPGHC